MESRLVPFFLALVSILPAADFTAPNYVGAVQRNFGGRPLPKWDRGHFLSYEMNMPVVYADDREGREEFRTLIAVPGVSQLMISDVAAAPKGGFAVTLAGSEGRVPFLVLLNSQGAISKVIQTGSALLRRIRYADDGTLWALVREFDNEFRELPDHNMLRQYNADGVLIRSVLNRQSVFPGKKEPSNGPWLSVSSDRIGFYADNAGIWTEASLDGQLLGQWKVPDSAPDTNVMITKVELTSANDVVANAQYTSRKGSSHGVYLFNRASSSLEPIDASKVPASFSLGGVDGDNVVVFSSRMAKLFWVGLQK